MHVFLRGIIWWSLATHEFTLGIPNLPQHFEYSSESSSRKWSNRMPVRMIKSIPKQGLNKHLYIIHLYCYIRKILLNKSPNQHLLVIIEPETKWQPFGRRHFPNRNTKLFIHENAFGKCIFMNDKFCISIRNPHKFVPKGPINHNPALIPTMAWCSAEHAIGHSLPTNFTRKALRGQGTRDKPLSEPMLTQFTDEYTLYICGTRRRCLYPGGKIMQTEFKLIQMYIHGVCNGAVNTISHEYIFMIYIYKLVF